jgi:hypothetical protein
MLCVSCQVVLFGGTAFNSSGPRLSLSTTLYILDFSNTPPLWRTAQVSLNNQGGNQLASMDSPNTGVAMLPEFGAVALQHREVSGLLQKLQEKHVNAIGRTDAIILGPSERTL